MGEYQTFWNKFFEVFGVPRRSVAIYQRMVEKLGGRHGFIDLFWPGTLVVEHKSAGASLDSAFMQAADYTVKLSDDDKPRYVIVTDYQRLRLYDLEVKVGTTAWDILLKDLPRHIRRFAFIPGYEIREYQEERPVDNKKAVKKVVELYRSLAVANYERGDLDKLLVRLVFCFFADDTGIFDKEVLHWYLRLKTEKDGSDFGSRLGTVFQVLNTPLEKRSPDLDEELTTLPYVNGGLFEEPIPIAFMNAKMRGAILDAADFDWSKVSPAVFGSMFQFVVDITDADLRHDLGAHYTSEKNILKVISSLFLDDLRAELEVAGHDHAKLQYFWNRLTAVKLLDPACGCGNFLVVAYRELRKLEMEVIRRIYPIDTTTGMAALPEGKHVQEMSQMSVEQLYGVEIEAFPVEIAKLSLWLADHLANRELGDHFGVPFAKLPLLEQPHIVCANALVIDWSAVVEPKKLTYILGNPPFVGSRMMNDSQKNDMRKVFGNLRELGFLDYVTAWYMKAARYIQNTKIQCAFVSTNSISQGEQVGILWTELQKLGIHIQFAHRTFKWSNEAPGKAAVYCVIVGFAGFDMPKAGLFDYADVGGEPHMSLVSGINPYLVAGSENVFVRNRQRPICNAPTMSFGNMPRDGGGLILESSEKLELIAKEPGIERFIRPYIGAREFLHNEKRWCFWLVDAPPDELRGFPDLMKRIRYVQVFRETSKAAATRAMAETPSLFAQRTQPSSDYILIPSTSSENRHYIPIGFLTPDVIASNSCHIIPSATLYHFGMLESEMHMTWVRAVCGRLKSDYRYSKDIVYNNFPWPKDVDNNVAKAVEAAAQAILDVRAKYTNSSLADLYDPRTMPKDLLDAHHILDRAVDHCYGAPSFESEPERLKFLFNLYAEYVKVK